MFECVPLEQDFTTFDVSLSSILRFSTQFGPPTPQFGPPKPDFGPLGAHRPPPKTPKPPPDCSPKPPSAPEVDKYGQHAIRSSPLERERHPPNQNPHFESPLWGWGWGWGWGLGLGLGRGVGLELGGDSALIRKRSAATLMARFQ